MKFGIEFVWGIIVGIFLILVFQYMGKRFKRSRTMRSRRPASKSTVRLEYLAALMFVLITYSAIQIYEIGRVTWHSDAFYLLRDAVNTAGASFGGQPLQVAEFELSGRVTEIIDGDSIVIRTPDFEYVEVRLYGIDTPEYNQPHGLQASRELSRLIASRNVGLAEKDIDDYGRTVAEVFYDGENINLEMIRSGSAWWYQYYARGEREYRDAQRQAKEAAVGLWVAPDPIPPWQWRRR